MHDWLIFFKKISR